RRMFAFPGPGVLTWRAVGFVLFGIGIAVIEALLPFLRRSPDGCFADDWRKKAEASGKFGDRVRPAPSNENITLSDPTYSGTSTDIFSFDEK
ncbi:MAG TPA: hypothetical protein VH518_18710, partial [Tepidisphaeraceae bacterium]